MRRIWLRLLIGLVVVGVIGGVVWANLAGGARAARGSGPLVRVEAAAPADLSARVLAPGVVNAWEEAEVRAPFNSRRVTFLVEEGDVVAAGAPLAELDTTDITEQIDRLRTALAQQRSNLAGLERRQDLAPRQASQRLTQAENQLQQARVSLAQAEVQLALSASALAATLEAQQREEQAAADRLAQAERDFDLSRRRLEQGRISAAEVDAAWLQMEDAAAVLQAEPGNSARQTTYLNAANAYRALVQRYEDQEERIATELAQAEQQLVAAGRELSRLQGGETTQVSEARLRLENAQAAVDSARLGVLAAEQAVATARLEAESGAVLPEEIAAVSQAVAAAEADLARWQERLGRATLVAPLSGTVLQRVVDRGAAVMDGAPVLRVGDMAAVRLEMRVDEADLGRLRTGQQVRFTTLAYPGESFAAEVVHIAPAAVLAGAQGTRQFLVEARADNSDGRLKPGMQIDAQITTESLTDVISLPVAVVRSDDDGDHYVFVFVDGAAVRRAVTLGLRTRTHVEIIGGLELGELVVVGPFDMLRRLEDGQAVRTQDRAGAAGEGR